MREYCAKRAPFADQSRAARGSLRSRHAKAAKTPIRDSAKPYQVMA
jgi:hypothetical protein